MLANTLCPEAGVLPNEPFLFVTAGDGQTARRLCKCDFLQLPGRKGGSNQVLSRSWQSTPSFRFNISRAPMSWTKYVRFQKLEFHFQRDQDLAQVTEDLGCVQGAHMCGRALSRRAELRPPSKKKKNARYNSKNKPLYSWAGKSWPYRCVYKAWGHWRSFKRLKINSLSPSLPSYTFYLYFFLLTHTCAHTHTLLSRILSSRLLAASCGWSLPKECALLGSPGGGPRSSFLASSLPSVGHLYSHFLSSEAFSWFIPTAWTPTNSKLPHCVHSKPIMHCLTSPTIIIFPFAMGNKVAKENLNKISGSAYKLVLSIFLLPLQKPSPS